MRLMRAPLASRKQNGVRGMGGLMTVTRTHPPVEVLPRGVGLDDAELQRADVEREWSVICARLTDTDLDGDFEYASMVGPRFRNRVEDILTQLFRHRGTIAAGSRSLDRRASILC
jgi:hypothetical protein